MELIRSLDKHTWKKHSRASLCLWAGWVSLRSINAACLEHAWHSVNWQAELGSHRETDELSAPACLCVSVWLWCLHPLIWFYLLLLLQWRDRERAVLWSKHGRTELFFIYRCLPLLYKTHLNESGTQGSSSSSFDRHGWQSWQAALQTFSTHTTMFTGCLKWACFCWSGIILNPLCSSVLEWRDFFSF